VGAAPAAGRDDASQVLAMLQQQRRQEQQRWESQAWAGGEGLPVQLPQQHMGALAPINRAAVEARHHRSSSEQQPLLLPGGRPGSAPGQQQWQQQKQKQKQLVDSLQALDAVEEMPVEDMVSCQCSHLSTLSAAKTS
jgi:hypothetical protein